MGIARLSRKLDDEAIARYWRSRSGITEAEIVRERRTHIPREAQSYRAARRNEALRTKPKTTWGPDSYYG
jgi:hypothetical protein